MRHYAVAQRRAASTREVLRHPSTKVVAAQRHQGDHHAAAREAYGPRPVLRHDRGRIKAITKNEATHSFTSRRLKRRRALAVV